MIPLAQYTTFIDKHSFYSLALNKRFDQEGDTEPTAEELAVMVDPAEAQAKAIIENRFGYLPSDAAFLETATVTGVIYIFSRKPGNKVSQDEIDQRRQTFFDMLPSEPGSQSRADVQSQPSKLGDWP